MFSKNHDALYEPQNIFLWFLLALQGGYLNVGGFLGVGRFVSHVTGFATLFGVEAYKNHWAVAFGMFATPIFFIGGTMVSAWFIERRRILGKQPWYSLIFLHIILCLICTGVLGYFGFFGDFGNHLDSVQNFYYLFILAYVCGLQNAVISSVSGSVIRTTHLTGPATDLGIGIVRYITKFPQPNKRETFAAWCRFGIFVWFTVGSLVGAYIFSQYHFVGFIIPVLISSFVAFRLRNHTDDE